MPSQPRQNISIEYEPDDSNPQFAILRSHGEDAVGLVEGLARVIDDAGCAFKCLDFSLGDLNQNRYKLVAQVRSIGLEVPGSSRLRALGDHLQRNGNYLHNLIGEEFADLDRTHTNTGHSCVHAVTCECPDREGILRGFVTGIRRKLANVAWLRADLVDGEVPKFVIMAIAAFPAVIDEKTVKEGIEAAFRERDGKDEMKSILDPTDPNYEPPPIIRLQEDADVDAFKMR